MNINGTFYFDPKDQIYQDHFPENPIVPGMLIIDSFVNALKQDQTLKDVDVKKFKFYKFVKPGKYFFSIKKQVKINQCKLFIGDVIYAKGEII